MGYLFYIPFTAKILNNWKVGLLFLPFLFIAPGIVQAQDKFLTQLDSDINQIKSDSLQIIQLIQLTRRIHHKNHREETEYKYAREAIDLALETNNTLLYARALDNLGLLYRYHERFSQAISLHTKAFQLVADKSDKEVNPLYKMIFANNAGVAARYDQRYALSTEYYLKALKIAREEKNLKNIAISSNGLGNTLSNIPGREEDAYHYFIQALNVEKTKNDSLGIAMNLLSISNYYLGQKYYEKALHYLDTLYNINSERADHFGLAITYQAYGDVYLKENKDSDKIKGYYIKSLHLFKKLNNKTKEAELLNSLGDLYQKTNHLNVALNYYLQSLELANKIHDKRLISKTSYAVSNIKGYQKEYAEALHYYKIGNAYEDSIALSKQKIKIAALTNQSNLGQKESKISQLQEESLQRKEMIDFHRTLFLIFVFVLLLILLFIYLQDKTGKSKKCALQLLHKNNEELLKAEYEKTIAQAEILATRSQLNPHLLFNSLNAINLLLQKEQIKNASQYIIVLSRFYRMILELPKSHTISLSEELELIKYYLTLEENRFGDKFQFKLNSLSKEEMAKINIPPLLLQPFVENAIWHGLLPSQKKTKILTISITKQNPDILVIIEDNGVGRENNESLSIKNRENKSFGLNITKERIEQFNKSYHCKITLSIIDKKDETEERLGTKVILTIHNCMP